MPHSLSTRCCVGWPFFRPRFWRRGSLISPAASAVSRLVPEPASYYVRLLLYYAPQRAAFVIAGALVAPRSLATACVLAGVAIALSLTVHILGQHSVGTTNYLHFAAESAGAIVGVVASAVARSRAAAARITAPG